MVDCVASEDSRRPGAKDTASESSSPTVRELFEEHAAYVHRTLRYLGVPPADLSDGVQEVFLVVHRKYAEFTPNASIRTWLYGICIRVAAGHRRRAHVRRERPVPEPPDQTVEARQAAELDKQQLRHRLAETLAQIDERKRAVFVLFEIEERPMKEVAEIVGCPVRTGYAWLRAARKEVMTMWQRDDRAGEGA
jgi:RNA polymerase sigma-70 factor (ECF subfamily)